MELPFIDLSLSPLWLTATVGALLIAFDIKFAIFSKLRLVSSYQALCRAIVSKFETGPYNSLARLSQVVPFTVFTLAFSKLNSWGAVVGLVLSISLVWFTSSLEATQRDLKSDEERDDLTKERDKLLKTLGEQEKHRLIGQEALRGLIETKIKELANFSNDQRATIYLLVEPPKVDESEPKNDPYYIMIARYSSSYKYRYAKKFHKESSSKIGAIGLGHSTPLGINWAVSKDNISCDDFYNECCQKFTLSRRLAETITMKCKTICVRQLRYDPGDHLRGLLIVESKTRQLAPMKTVASELIVNTVIRELVDHYRTCYLADAVDVTSEELKQWERQILNVPSPLSATT